MDDRAQGDFRADYRSCPGWHRSTLVRTTLACRIGVFRDLDWLAFSDAEPVEVCLNRESRERPANRCQDPTRPRPKRRVGTLDVRSNRVLTPFFSLPLADKRK